MDKENKMTYEQAMRELEKTVSALESGNIDMDKAFELYEKGLALTKFCENYLNEKEKLLKKEEE